MDRPKGLPVKKSDKARYYLEVAEQCRHKAQEAEKRIEKAMEMGADDPSHKHYKLYLDLMEIAERNWKYHEEYLKHYSEETKEKMPNAEAELKKKKKKSSKK